jgi:hypothetical protein
MARTRYKPEEIVAKRAAVARWPMARVMLRQGTRVVHDSGEQLAH